MTEGKGTKKQVLRGEKIHTSGNLTAADLTTSKKRKIVSKKRSELSKSNPWIAATQEARKVLNIEGWQVPKKGTEFYNKAKEIYEKNKDEANK